MDEWLAKVYGTGGQSEDIEKTAQVEMLQKLAEQEGIDLDGLSAEQLESLSDEVFAEGEESGEEGGEEAGEEEGMEASGGDEEQLQEKFAEADFLGRVMAHSYAQELQKIAASKGHMGRRERESAKMSDKAGKGVGRLRNAFNVARGKAHRFGAAAGRLAKAHPRKALGAGAALAAGAGFAAGRTSKTKTASVLIEKLAEQRALEMLAEAGYEVE